MTSSTLSIAPFPGPRPVRVYGRGVEKAVFAAIESIGPATLAEVTAATEFSMRQVNSAIWSLCKKDRVFIYDDVWSPGVGRGKQHRYAVAGKTVVKETP